MTGLLQTTTMLSGLCPNYETDFIDSEFAHGVNAGLKGRVNY